MRDLVDRSGIPARWLETALTPEAEAAQLALIASGVGASVFITDLDQPEARGSLAALHRGLGGHGHRLAILGGARDVNVDTVVIPYVGAEAPSDPGATRYLVGPEYFVLRPELAQLRGMRAALRRQSDRIAVSLGGADPGRRTIAVCEALASAGRPLEVRVVIGPAFAEDHLRELRVFADTHGVSLMRGDDLPSALVWCDLFITADGLTKYEAAALGSPTLVIQAPETRTQLSGRFAEAGSARYVPGVPPTRDDIAAAVADLLDDPASRAMMTARALSLIDGAGATRIIEALPL